MEVRRGSVERKVSVVSTKRIIKIAPELTGAVGSEENICLV